MTRSSIAVLSSLSLVVGLATGWFVHGSASRRDDDGVVRRRLVEVCNATRSQLRRLQLAVQGTSRVLSDPDRVYAQLDVLSYPAAVCTQNGEEVVRIVGRDWALAPEAELKPRLEAMIADILVLLPSRKPGDRDLEDWQP